MTKLQIETLEKVFNELDKANCSLYYQPNGLTSSIKVAKIIVSKSGYEGVALLCGDTYVNLETCLIERFLVQVEDIKLIAKLFV